MVSISGPDNYSYDKLLIFLLVNRISGLDGILCAVMLSIKRNQNYAAFYINPHYNFK